MRDKGQSILDYTFLFAIVIVALLIMGYYIRNSFSGKWREVGETISQGEVYRPDVSGQSHPSNIIRNTVTNTNPP